MVGVGAKSGLGAALARRFAREGLRVTIAGRTPERLLAVAEQIVAPGGAIAIKPADATSEADVAALFEEADRDGDLKLVPMWGTISPHPLRTRRRNSSNASGDKTPWAASLSGERPPCAFPTRARHNSFHRRDRVLAGASALPCLRRRQSRPARRRPGPRPRVWPKGRSCRPYRRRRRHRRRIAATTFAEYARSKGADGVLAVDDIADAYWALHCQKRSASTHEMDLRPFKEPF